MKLREVMVVDDSDDQRELIQIVVNKHDPLRPVRALADGHECLEALRGGAPVPALVLIDLHMPGLDGAATVRHIRADAALPPWLRIVMLSGSDSVAELRRCYAAGVDSFVSKPSGTGDWAGTLLPVLDYWLRIDGSGRC